MEISWNVKIDLTPETNFEAVAEALIHLDAAVKGTDVAAPAKPAKDASKQAAALKREAKKKADALKKAAKTVEDAEAAAELLDDGDDDGTADEAEAPTLDQVKKAVRDFIKKNNIADMKKILKDSFGVTKLSDLDETRYSELVDLLKA